MGENGSNFRGWLLVIGISISFVIYGLLVFMVVAEKPWPPQWEYGIFADVPGQSPYSTAKSRRFFETGVEEDLNRPARRQHVDQKPETGSLP